MPGVRAEELPLLSVSPGHQDLCAERQLGTLNKVIVLCSVEVAPLKVLYGATTIDSRDGASCPFINTCLKK